MSALKRVSSNPCFLGFGSRVESSPAKDLPRIGFMTTGANPLLSAGAGVMEYLCRHFRALGPDLGYGEVEVSALSFPGVVTTAQVSAMLRREGRAIADPFVFIALICALIGEHRVACNSLADILPGGNPLMCEPDNRGVVLALTRLRGKVRSSDSFTLNLMQVQYVFGFFRFAHGAFLCVPATAIHKPPPPRQG